MMFCIENHYTTLATANHYVILSWICGVVFSMHLQLSFLVLRHQDLLFAFLTLRKEVCIQVYEFIMRFLFDLGTAKYKYCKSWHCM